MKKTLSIIIVNFRSLKYLDKCLTSIYTILSSADFEIVIVNNDKNESLTSILKKFPAVILLDHKKNVGFGRGVNMGAAVAQGEILFLLNPDSEIIQGDAGKILREFDRDNRLGILGASLLGKDNNRQKWSAGKDVTLSRLVLANLGINSDKKIWSSVDRIFCAWVGGGAMFVRKKLFDKLQGFDENFFMYFEDVDFCKRAREIGYKVLYYPNFKIRHIGGGSFGKDNGKSSQKKHFYKSQDYYFKKFYKNKAPFVRLIKRILHKK